MNAALLILAAPTVPLAVWLGAVRARPRCYGEAEGHLWAMLAASWLIAVLWVVLR